ncbi:hypothetical protein [Chelativorans salis]|uniref:Uncharacterized protein n=1 Tax=Chelativorans salis TaxID=2978478 RepID=A0ABT2LUX7_9HYPH|nr:hypothetical protein [Chelativorans sp. EGI FJ00035]MCT7378340.1 hypothetical protein [Chelativorans sp. EGI FJ00035]
MPRFSPKQDAQIYAELQPQLPHVRKAVKRMSREMEKLSDIGQAAAVVEITLEFILRHLAHDQAGALALSEHLRTQIDIGIKKVMS